MICKKHQIKVGHKFQLPKKLLTLDAANNIKKAAEMTEDDELLLEITKVGLVCKRIQTSWQMLPWLYSGTLRNQDQNTCQWKR